MSVWRYVYVYDWSHRDKNGVKNLDWNNENIYHCTKKSFAFQKKRENKYSIEWYIWKPFYSHKKIYIITDYSGIKIIKKEKKKKVHCH